MSAPRLHADMDPLRRRLGITPLRAPTTPPPVPAPTAPAHPPPPPGPAEDEDDKAPKHAQPPTSRAPRHGVTEAAGDAAASAVRTLPQSPTAAAFGAAQQLVGSGRAAVRSASRIPSRSPLDRGDR